ncbi:hypothetical protein THAOC_31146, partial [Thalassiosira oceanica]
SFTLILSNYCRYQTTKGLYKLREPKILQFLRCWYGPYPPGMKSATTEHTRHAELAFRRPDDRRSARSS